MNARNIALVSLVSALASSCSAALSPPSPAVSPAPTVSLPTARPLPPALPVTPTTAELTMPLSPPGYLETLLAEPTPSPAPYWDSSQLVISPEGGWTIYRNEELGFSFEYPAQYNRGPCGSISLERFEGVVTVNLEGGTISIDITQGWNGDLDAYVSEELFRFPTQLLTPVESFSIDGVPALRVIRGFPGPSANQYDKLAFASLRDSLYSFRYALSNWHYCDAPPLSEEAVYEHLIATWHFYR